MQLPVVPRSCPRLRSAPSPRIAAVAAAGDLLGARAVRGARAVVVAAAAMVCGAACGGGGPPVDRDWTAHPAIVTRTTTAEIVAVGDVHGGYERLVPLLQTGGLVASDSGAPGGFRWTGGDRVLVCTGDIIDKGTQAIPVMDLFIALEPQARAAGGDVIVTMGNHEAEFLAEPNGDKTVEFRKELEARGIDPTTLREGATAWGRWLLERPLAAVVNGWFFSHGGDTHGKSAAELASTYQSIVAAGDWPNAFLVGDDSILEARSWWQGASDPKALLDGYLAAVGARHIVFGHDPGAIGTRGQVSQDRGGRLVLIDVGMSPAINDSRGALLFITRDGGNDVSSVMEADGARRTLLISAP